MKAIYNNQKGTAMIITIIAVTVVTLLGYALWAYSSSEVRITEREVNRAKAHYLARSGAESIAQYMVDNINSGLVTTVLSGTSVSSDPKVLGDGTFIVSVSKQNDDILIESTGEVRGVSDKVTLLLSKRTATFSAIFDRAIFSVGNLDITHTNARVFGDVESNGRIFGEPNSGEVYEYSDRYFPSPVIPHNGDLGTHVNISTNDDFTLKWSDYPNGVYIENIDIGPSGNLIIEVPEDEVFILKVHKYNNKGNTDVVGDGVVMLFITHSAELQTPHTMTPDAFLVILADGAVASLRANGTFSGYIYGPNATTILQSKWSTVNGAIITGGMYGNISQARFIGTVSHEVREKLDMSTLGEYIPVVTTFDRMRWGY